MEELRAPLDGCSAPASWLRACVHQQRAEKELAMTFADVTPNLVVSNLDRSLTFYRDVLGFSLVTTVPEQPPFVFAWLQRDTVSVFLNSEAAAKMGTAAGTNMLFIT